MAILAHGVTLNFLRSPGPWDALRSLKQVQAVKIHTVRIESERIESERIESGKIPPVNAPPIPSTAVLTASRPISTFLPEASGRKSPSHAYTDLLPQHQFRVFEAETHSEVGQQGTLPPLIQGRQLAPSHQVSADAFASYISIPLVWRSEGKDGRAVVRLSIDDLETIWIRSLYGEPILRAVLFESLAKVPTQTYLRELMATQRRRELTIELLFEQSPDSYRGLNTESVAFEDGIRIKKRLPPPMPKMSGIALSDRHSERAKVEEKLRLAKLFEIPAFTHTLTDYPLSKKI